MKTSKILSTTCLGLILLGTVLLTNCKKDEKEPEPVPAPTPVCIAPVITSSAQGTVNTGTYEFKANITEIDNSSLIVFTVNGVSFPFSYNASTDVLIANITLVGGTNTISITANGCQLKSSSFTVVYVNNTTKLTGKNFKLTALTVNSGFTTDLYAQMDACSKDNIMSFKANGTYTYDEGVLKCNLSDPQTTSGIWIWNTDETRLILTETGSTSQSLDIITNDGTTLKFTITEVSNGVSYTITETYTKQ